MEFLEEIDRGTASYPPPFSSRPPRRSVPGADSLPGSRPDNLVVPAETAPPSRLAIRVVPPAGLLGLTLSKAKSVLLKTDALTRNRTPRTPTPSPRPTPPPEEPIPLAVAPEELVRLVPAPEPMVRLVPVPTISPIRVRLQRSRWKAIVGSIPPTILWLGFAFLMYWSVCDRAWWTLKYEATMICLGLIGTVRYTWLLINAARSYYYQYAYFPKVRRAAEALADPYPPQLCFVVASYKEEDEVSRLCFASIASELRAIPSEVHVIVSVGSEPEAVLIRAVMRDCGATNVRLHFTLQSQGKRKALAHAMRVARSVIAPHPGNVLILMDGDSALGEGCLRATLPLFKLRPALGAVTVDNEAVFLGPVPEVVQRWYAVKFMKRHHMMMSHALSHRVMTLTGRFSVYRASAVLTDEAIYRMENDTIDHWVHGKIKFLMGDDKSTMFTLLRNGWEMGYAPDAFVACLETRSGNFVEVIRSLMVRWYGNMLRTNGRSIALGTRVMPLFSWFCFVDQRLNPWTTLTGPVGAVLLFFFWSPYYLLFYAVWVILTRLGQLWLTAVVHGHKMWWLDVPLQVLEQWYGSGVKVYCLFNLNKQKWSKKGTTSTKKEVDDRSWMSRRVGPVVFALNVVVFLIVVLMLSGLLKLPPLL